MQLENLNLKNFRNYVQETINLESGLNILQGRNGQGKTNILEGIYYLLTGKSYRIQRDQELILWGKDNFNLSGDFKVSGRRIHLECNYLNKKKFFKINNVPCSKLSEYVGIVNAVFFSPDDLFLVKGGPSERRRFLDIHLAQLKPSYIKVINSYNRVLHQKNALLKSNISVSAKIKELASWNEQLSMYGEQIIKSRLELTEKLQSFCFNIYTDLSANNENIKLTYSALSKKDPELAIKSFLDLLEKNKEQEIERQCVLIGPHRDDLIIELNSRSAKLFGSQGQQRSIVLSLKLAELNTINKEKGTYPLLLLDDVLSELDNFRREYLLDFIKSAGNQTLMTMTSAETLSDIKLSTLYNIKEGHIRRVK